MEELSLSTLAERMKSARKAKKKTQEEVAEAIGVNKYTISDWERGTKQPGILNMVNYCNFLGITIDELLDIKKQTYFAVKFTEEELDTIFSMIDECEQVSEISQLPQKLHFLKQYLKALFSRAQSK